MGNHSSNSKKDVFVSKPIQKFASETPPKFGDNDDYFPPFWVEYDAFTEKKGSGKYAYEVTSYRSRLNEEQLQQHIFHACLPAYQEAIAAFVKTRPAEPLPPQEPVKKDGVIQYKDTRRDVNPWLESEKSGVLISLQSDAIEPQYYSKEKKKFISLPTSFEATAEDGLDDTKSAYPYFGLGKVTTRALQYFPCAHCKKYFHGIRHDCNGCRSSDDGPSYCICGPCYTEWSSMSALKKKIYHQHDNFQSYHPTEEIDTCRLVLYRNYSAIVSRPQDHFVLTFAPCFNDYVAKNHQLPLENLYWEGAGVDVGFSLSTFDMRSLDTPILHKEELPFKVISAFGLDFARGIVNLELFPSHEPVNDIVTSIVWPTILLHCSNTSLVLSKLLVAMTRVSRQHYHSIRAHKEALGKANVLAATHDSRAMLAHFGRESTRTMSWARANDLLCQGQRYCTVAVMQAETPGQEEMLVMDVHLGLWRSIQVARVTDYRKAQARRADFLRTHPGYID